VWTLEAADRGQLQEKAVERLVKCVCCVSTKQAKKIEGEGMSEAELEDRFTWVERLALCIIACVFLVILGFAAGLTWLIAPECDCK
jgi:hypothetical protein